MTSTLTVSADPETQWQHKAKLALEDAFGHPFQIWSREYPQGWIPFSASTDGAASNEESSISEQTDCGLLDSLNDAAESGQADISPIAPSTYRVAVPLSKRSVATSTIATDRPEVLQGIAELSRSYFLQHAENVRLREENDFFLKQVSDDFEELTFLRSMADQLGLGDKAHTLQHLVTATLPELGKSSHAEELYFINNQSVNGLSLLASWTLDHSPTTDREETVILYLVEKYLRSCRTQPLIKNAFDTTVTDEFLMGIRDFVLVTVGPEEEPVGWFLAINRVAESGEGAEPFPEWRLNQHEFGTSEASLLSTAAAMIASHVNNLHLFQEREALLVNVVRTLVYAVEAKDRYTCGHSERVALYAKRLAQQVGYSEEDSELLYLTGLLHDIGKIAINDAILNKPGRLTEEEFAEIQRHPEEGWKILHELPQLAYVLPGVLHHHERFDGKGYPDQLSDLEIPFDGRILAVADAYDAMTSDRAYRKGMPHEKAASILQAGSGTQWDPKIVEAFLQIAPEITELRENYQPRSHRSRKCNLSCKI